MVAQTWRRDRVQAGAGVALLHALLGYALLTGLGAQVVRSVGTSLQVFDVPNPPPPKPIADPPAAESKAAEGEASPPNLKARPTPVVAPPPKIRIKAPQRVPAAPKPAPVHGNDRSAGNAAVPGPGTGSGGSGSGTGSGGSGLGEGGGGGAARAVRLSGQLANSDYPRSALRAGVEGSVSVRYVVGTDGSVSGCTVTRSSGDVRLDETTCRLIELRFRYRPARNSAGEPVPETVRKTFDWLIPGRARAAAP
jgi:protein TonB